MGEGPKIFMQSWEVSGLGRASSDVNTGIHLCQLVLEGGTGGLFFLPVPGSVAAQPRLRLLMSQRIGEVRRHEVECSRASVWAFAAASWSFAC